MGTCALQRTTAEKRVQSGKGPSKSGNVERLKKNKMTRCPLFRDVTNLLKVSGCETILCDEYRYSVNCDAIVI